MAAGDTRARWVADIVVADAEKSGAASAQADDGDSQAQAATLSPRRITGDDSARL